MLKNLIKYDLKWLLKIIVIFIILGFIFAVIGRLFSLIEDSVFFNILSSICNGISISMFLNAIFNSVFRGWARFSNNLYKDESYLTHTLPVTKNTHFLAKVLSIIISILLSCLGLFIGLFIMYYSKENIEIIKNSLTGVSNLLDSSIFELIFVVCVVLVLEIIFIVFSGIFGIVVGNTYNHKKTLKSVIYGFIIYMALNMVTIIGIVIVSLFNENLKGIIFGGNKQLEFRTLVNMLYSSLGIYLIYNVGLYYFTNKIFNKGVNIE